MKFCVVLSSLLIFSQLLWANPKQSRLVVVVTLDQFFPEWMNHYQSVCTQGGFARLIGPQGKQSSYDYSYFFSQRGVDHASIFTGTSPRKHGIPSLNWYNDLLKKNENAVDDKQYQLVGIENGVGASPKKMEQLTLGTLMKMNNSFSRSFSVAPNKEEAILSAGTGSDGAFWFDEEKGKWTTSTFYGNEEFKWLTLSNLKQKRDSVMRQGWLPYGESDTKSAMRFVGKITGQDKFYYDLMKAHRDYKTYRILKATPYINTFTLDFSKQLIKEYNIGRDNDADLLSISLSCLDYMNHDFKVYAPEFKDLMIRMDQDLSKFWSFLDKQVGRENYTVVVTTTQAREYLPIDLASYKYTGGYFSIYKAMALLKSYLNLQYGSGEWIVGYNQSEVFLNRNLITQKKLSLEDIQYDIARFLIEFEGIGEVIPAHILFQDNQTKMSQSYYNKRCGDLFIEILPYWSYEVEKDQEHNRFYSRRTAVPVYAFGNGADFICSEELNQGKLLKKICKLVGIQAPYTIFE